ncbi:MAG: glycoside hydrolase family 6 protein [Actinomycetota bacterium]|nr:glycoside hydrolase family 6 protein [Actinomycetota bacterium]
MRLRKLRRYFVMTVTLLAGVAGLSAAGAAGAIPASAATGCSVAYTVTNQWNTGFGVSISITDLGSPVTSWTLGYTYSGNQQLTQGWSGNWSQSGAHVTVTNESYNGSLGTGASTQIGANFSYSGTNTSPTTFTLNGVTCTGQVGGGGGGGSIAVNPASLSVTEGTTGTVGVSLSAAPSANVTVSVTGSGNTGLTASPTSLTFTPSNFGTAQNVTITANSSSTGTTTFTLGATGYTSVTVTASETTSGGGGGGGHVADPYAGSKPYLNPDYVKEVQAQATADGSSAEAAVATYQTAIWLDTISAINGTTGRTGLRQQLTNAAAAGTSATPSLVEIVVYDLPGRDCAALASNGEIPATAAGLTQYETQYIDPIATILNGFASSNIRVVAIVEPDSLPNVVTNQNKPACATATPYYEQGITYALNKLHAISNVYNYLDIAHSGWLGWPNNISQTPAVYNTVVKGTTAGYASIDGFISNTANYTPTQEPFLPNPTLNVGGNPLDSVLFYQFNPTFDELTYDTQMYNTLVAAGFPSSKRFLIDTSRNGWGGPLRPTALNSSPTTAAAYVAANKIDQRPFRGDWCNQNNAGIGARPADQPLGASSPILAYVWIKPPGESDGDYPSGSHTHGDPHCDPAGTNTDGNGGTYSTGAIPGFDVPAGQWFAAEFQMLVRNSYPVLP